MSKEQLTLADVVEELKSEGYTQNYTMNDGELKSLETGETTAPEKYTINRACRFDIVENVTDEQFLFGIDSPEGKGIIVDLLGNVYFDNEEIIEEKLESPIEHHIATNEATTETKYGLRKVFKETFEQNPNQFELRIGFPDYPRCPFDTGFSMLGYDKKTGEYVWLVTSILKDERLTRKHYTV